MVVGQLTAANTTVAATMPSTKTVFVYIRGAKDLKDIEVFGVPDPYVVCSFPGTDQFFETPVVYNDLNPEFNFGLFVRRRESKTERIEEQTFLQPASKPAN